MWKKIENLFFSVLFFVIGVACLYAAYYVLNSENLCDFMVGEVAKKDCLIETYIYMGMTVLFGLSLIYAAFMKKG